MVKQTKQIFPPHDVCDYCGKEILKGPQYRFKLGGKSVWVNDCCWKKLIEKGTPVK